MVVVLFLPPGGVLPGLAVVELVVVVVVVVFVELPAEEISCLASTGLTATATIVRPVVKEPSFIVEAAVFPSSVEPSNAARNFSTVSLSSSKSTESTKSSISSSCARVRLLDNKRRHATKKTANRIGNHITANRNGGLIEMTDMSKKKRISRLICCQKHQ